MKHVTFQRCNGVTASTEDLEKFSHKLAEISCKVFTHGPHESDEDFYKKTYGYFYERLSDKSYFFNCAEIIKSDDEIVGYVYFYVAKMKLHNKKSYNIIRCDAGMLPEYRGHNLPARLACHLGIVYLRKNLFSRNYFLMEILSPASYKMISNFNRTVYPGPLKNASEEIVELYGSLLKSHNINLSGTWCSAYPECAVEVSEPELQKLRASDSQAIQFYLEHNPRYYEGFSMPVIMRAQVRELVYLLRTVVKRTFRSSVSLKKARRVSMTTR